MLFSQRFLAGFVIAAGLMAAPVAASAENPAVEGAAAKAEKADTAPKLICRAGKRTGSRLPAKKKCATAEEWAATDGAAADTMQRMGNNPTKLD